MKKIFLFLTLLVFGCSHPSIAQKINSGQDIIQAMYDTYEGKWYENITFKQETTFYGPDGTVQQKQIWYEAIKLPGQLAIKFGEMDSPNGILFADNVQYGFSEGKLIQEVPRIHDLLVLGFDVYHQPVDTTLALLKKSGYNLEKWYGDEWQGREVYVIGTDTVGTQVNQFWIDKERLVFLRSVKIGRQNSIQDTRFNKYEPLMGGWIAPEVEFMVNGNLVMFEDYSNIQIPESLDDAIFDPETFLNSTW